MISRRTIHAVASALAGIAIAFFVTNHPAVAGIVISIAVLLLIWSVESIRNKSTTRPEKRS
jgi:hypothetical protein